MESVMDGVVAVATKVTLALDNAEACLPLDALRAICEAHLEAAVSPHATAIRDVQCVSIVVENADCSDEKRRASGQDPVAKVDAVIVLEDAPNAFIDMDAVVSSGVGVLSMQEEKMTSGSASDDVELPTEQPPASKAASSSNTVIGVSAGAAVGVVLASLAGWKAYTKYSASSNTNTEGITVVVTSSTLYDESTDPVDKSQIERMLLGLDSPPPTVSSPAVTSRAPIDALPAAQAADEEITEDAPAPNRQEPQCEAEEDLKLDDLVSRVSMRQT
eukprot:2272191-Rhodomonas_salina.3